MIHCCTDVQPNDRSIAGSVPPRAFGTTPTSKDRTFGRTGDIRRGAPALITTQRIQAMTAVGDIRPSATASWNIGHMYALPILVILYIRHRHRRGLLLLG